jgi:prepilin-type N-terminal cleavage/methylation domain-containing protein
MSNKYSNANGTKTDSNLLGKNNGFSLIELLIAMAILSLGMLAAASMQYSAIRNNTNGNIYTQANMLAKTRLESLKNLDIESPDLAAGTYGDPTSIDENEQPGGIYNRSWTITNLGTLSRHITVTVQWARLGQTYSVVISSSTRGNGI